MTLFVSSGASGIAWPFPKHVETLEAMWSVSWAASDHSELIEKFRSGITVVRSKFQDALFSFWPLNCSSYVRLHGVYRSTETAIARSVVIGTWCLREGFFRETCFPWIAKWSMERLADEVPKTFKLENVLNCNIKVKLELTKEEKEALYPEHHQSEAESLRRENAELKRENEELRKLISNDLRGELGRLMRIVCEESLEDMFENHEHRDVDIVEGVENRDVDLGEEEGKRESELSRKSWLKRKSCLRVG
ncbi:hypothetical protein IFM89_024552 [Coptis chinensis]|uniref:Uncharacterized protein n=1 Tax=Coptis chinensis TaxID=261450 RepID=A0A835IPW8_9MAGN|nr:hypothetical protein IFM89_024552 [Coptis chinensis]